MAKAAGVENGTPVRISTQPGRIVIEAAVDPTLKDMLRAFDPKRHGKGGEAMAFEPVGAEVI
ncbi:MAG: hypothetical protein EXR28_05745 [Betaproteobacteria bacterium]|nr:hypothetical protein [Betaproteobacteria bacterium]